MPDRLRVLVTGSRQWQDWDAVCGAIADLAREHHGQVVVVHGAARSGADKYADMAARALMLTPEPHPADWGTHGKRAGFIRNTEMVALGADLCLAFALPCTLPSCRKKEPHATHGTAHCVSLARKAGIPVQEFGYQEAGHG